MLRCLILAAGATPCGKSIEELANQCRRLAYASGICMIFLDEIQFLTKSQGATARITDVVYELMGLGVPITLVANYSLASALKRRPEQDRQRILGNTRILYQVPATSNDWINLVRGVVSISPSVIKIDPEEHASSVHNLTAGTPRMLSFLITHALASTRATRPEIRLDDLQEAYEAPGFSVCRESIEKLNQQFATGEQARADLWPPIRVPLEPQAALKQEAQEQAFARSANSLVEGYLSPSQLELLEELRQNHNASAEDETVVPIGKKAQPTIDDFDVGESILNKLRKKK